jgi:flagellar motility protein MotE (MotC chaperone)
MIKITIKKYGKYIFYFIVFFSVSFAAMIALKKRTEEQLRQLYTAKLSEINKEKDPGEGRETADKERTDVKDADMIRTLRKFSPEEISKYELELHQRIKLYENKVALLDKRERELEAFKTDLESRKTEIEAMRENLDEVLVFLSKERTDLDSDLVIFEESKRRNIRQLANMYAEMDGLKAAVIVAKIDHDVSAQILASMSPRKSANILAEMDSSDAATISSQMKRLHVTDSTSDETIKKRNLRKLAAIYQRMDPGKAISLIEKLDRKTVIGILSQMDHRNLARILELAETKKASKLVEEIRKIL